MSDSVESTSGKGFSITNHPSTVRIVGLPGPIVPAQEESARKTADQ